MREKLSPSSFIGVEGKDIISFGSGQPDLPPPREVFEKTREFREYKYGLIQGQKKLREALVEQYPGSTPDSFVITNGASEAIDLTLRALYLNKDIKKKKILIPKPYYYSYPILASNALLEPVFTELNNGRIDIEDFKKKFDQCCAVLINSPSNPTGRIESIDTLKEIENLSNDNGAYIISDEVYKDLIYERENYLIEGPKVITVNSFSKTFSMCGHRVGYLWARDLDLVDRVIGIKTHSSMNTNINGQEMAYEATKVPHSFVEHQVKIWKERRDIIYNGLKSIGLELWKPEGAFYVLPKVDNAEKVMEDLWYDYKVITYLGDWFGAPGHLRLSYALDKEKIEKGLNIIEQYLK